ncbi:NmrA family transcriptional regulator [Xanthomonas axonopodis pv. melhusii]|uniref:NmrA family transcriptional regulator n=1 Tax=Xanthomonas axonopodis pv. melhusii TaxID=487834 RepID=A0A1T1NWH6_9XANT|nr:NmrA family NAD(P)-binding protein [Xanthomonas axonopodis]OOW67739.1 NmrA family transcriptional regulator [Xanthomonas axonopodis pv. melhusii]
MSILVTGATGTVGSLVTQGLADAGAQVKALVRQQGKRPFPAGVTEVVADLTDVASMRAALASVRTLFLLNAVTPDEVTQALIALNLAKEAGIERIVYLSVIHADTYTNVPHFTGKHTVERMIETVEIPATILRPAYFMQNEGMVQQTITDHGVYPMPIGAQGIAMIDARDIADIADIAVVELLRRDRADGPLPGVTLELVGPGALTGTDVAKVWSAALGREIAYAGDDVAAFEAQLAKYGPSWLAYDMRLMMAGIQRFGMHAAEGTVAKLQTIVGRPLRTYEDFVREATAKA